MRELARAQLLAYVPPPSAPPGRRHTSRGCNSRGGNPAAATSDTSVTDAAHPKAGANSEPRFGPKRTPNAGLVIEPRFRPNRAPDAGRTLDVNHDRKASSDLETQATRRSPDRRMQPRSMSS